MASSGSAIRRPRHRIGRGPQIVAMLLVVGLLSAMAIQPTRALLQQNERISSMAGDLSSIERTNEKLRTRIERLQNPDYIEQQAREQAGLVMPGEVSYRVLPPSETKIEKKEQAKAEKAAPAPPEPGTFEKLLDFIGFI